MGMCVMFDNPMMDMRWRMLSGEVTVPGIRDLAFLSDCHSGAIVSREGSVEWLCLPRFDSPSVFGRLLDPDAGHWSIAPEAEHTTFWKYDDDTLVLCTRFDTEVGSVEVRDALAFAPGVRRHDIGKDSPHVLIRQVLGVNGVVPMKMEVAPRFEYGLTCPRLHRMDDGGIRATAGPVTVELRGDVPLEPCEGTIESRFNVSEGETVCFSLSYGSTWFESAAFHEDACRALEDTREAWRSWAEMHWGDGGGYDGEYRDLVRRSAMILQGLTYQPSAAVIAALTTSLPERIGGTWNWDYRFAWLRDASFMMHAMWVAACPTEPEGFFHWIDIAAGRSEESKVQIVYGVEGERDLSERQLRHLEGFMGSRPVRVGNDAWTQVQLDVLGEVLDAAWQLDMNVQQWSPVTKGLLTRFANYAANHWRDLDAGMWEARDRDRHYTSSKVMCWVALDRAIKLAERIDADEERVARWRKHAAEIHEAVLAKAWCAEKQAYAGAFGSDELDASVLLMPLVGFLDAHDERMRSTIYAIDDELGGGGVIRRWSEEPNGFLLTSYWMVQCLAKLGEVERARERFEQITAFSNDLGILAEEGDPRTGEPLGNLPQAFSHVGLINSAWEISVAAWGSERTPSHGGHSHGDEGERPLWEQ